MAIRRKITTAGNSAALVLSQDLLALMEIGVGDEVELALVDRTLTVRSVQDRTRDEAVSRAIDDVFARRGSLMTRLAGGVGASGNGGVAAAGGATAPRRAKAGRSRKRSV